MTSEAVSSEALSTAHLEESLRQCRLELAAVRERFEQLSENQAAADQARDQLAVLARHVDTVLTRAEWSPPGVRGWIKRRVSATVATVQEAADAKELRKSRLFDGAWYLSTYPEVAETGLSPALHYLRQGAGEGKDPGPEFSTKNYLAANTRLGRIKANPLLNHLRTGQ